MIKITTLDNIFINIDLQIDIDIMRYIVIGVFCYETVAFLNHAFLANSSVIEMRSQNLLMIEFNKVFRNVIKMSRLSKLFYIF